jgi:CRISPR/Cas system-associated exonuclease Cas4 (RecB family)
MTKQLDVLKLSTSSIKTYEKCPRNYYYRYILKPKIEQVEWDHLALGNFVHDVLEFFHNVLQKSPDKNFAQLMGLCCKTKEVEKDRKGELKFKMSGEIRKEAKKILKNYLGLLKKTGLPNVQANEKKFNVYLEDDLVIRGLVDREDLGLAALGPDKDPDRVHIIDYKSGKSKYLDDFQLLVYGIPVMEAHPELEGYEASYLVLKENMKFITYQFSRQDVEKVKQKIRNAARSIREDQTWEARPQFLCKYCDYVNICDAAHGSFKKKDVKGGEVDWV